MSRLLIVEDEEAHQELIEFALRDLGRSGYEWTIAGTLAEARDILNKESFDLILLDLSLPDSLYSQTLSRTQDFCNGTPIIVLTSLDDRKVIMGMIKKGAMDCVPKSMLGGLYLERTITYCLDRQNNLLKIIDRERELEKASSFQRLFERSRIGFVITDLQAKIVDANPAFADWLNYDRDQIVGKYVWDFTASEDIPQSREAIAKAGKAEFKEMQIEKRYIRSDGEKIWGNTVIQPIQWRNDEKCIIASIFDLTKHKEAELNLKEAYSLKSNLISMMSHDIKVPLANIITITSFFDKTKLSKDHADYIMAMRQSSLNMFEIVDDLLTFAQVENSSITLDLIPTDIAPVLDEINNLYSFLTEKKKIELSVLCDVGKARPVLDGSRLKQIISNLLSNAVKFTPKGGKILLMARVDQTTLTIDVADTGIGISPEDQKRIFQSFAQANMGIHKVFGGTGLGLSICNQLVELMGGSITVKSELDKGSTFTVTFPVGE